jgi:hypothetical protein
MYELVDIKYWRIRLSLVDFIAFSSEVERVRRVPARSFLVRNWCGARTLVAGKHRPLEVVDIHRLAPDRARLDRMSCADLPASMTPAKGKPYANFVCALPPG